MTALQVLAAGDLTLWAWLIATRTRTAPPSFSPWGSVLVTLLTLIVVAWAALAG